MSPRNPVRVSTVLVAAALLIPAAFGQGRGGGGGTGTTPTGTGGTGSTGTSGGTTAPGRGTPSTNPTQTTPTQPTSLPQPIFVSGRVMLEDGTAPTETIAIERVCNGQQHTEGYTDSRGYFAFELGRRNPGVLQDASEESNYTTSGGMDPLSDLGQSRSSLGGTGGMTMSENRFMGCDLRARLAGYRSQAISLAMRRPMDNPDVGVILLHRIGQQEGTTISASTLNAPKDARKAFEKGLDLRKKKKTDEAMKSFQKAVDVYPKFSAAWCELGRIQSDKGEAAAAHESFENSAKYDPRFVIPYVEMAAIDMQAEKWEELAGHTATAMKLDPFDYPQTFFLNALANYKLKKLDDAEKSAREAVKLDTQHRFPQSQQLLGVLLAQKQDYTGAAAELRMYLQLAPTATNAGAVKTQIEQLDKLKASATAKPEEQDK